MHWTRRGILWSFHLLLFIVPLIFLPNTSELFEFNKLIVTYLLTIMIGFFWVSRMATEGRIIFKKTLLDWPILIFLSTQLLSLFFSIDIRTSWFGYYSRFNGGLTSLLCYVILYWSAVSNFEPKNIKSFISTTLVSGTIVAFWGFLERLGIDASWWVQDVQNRVFSTLGQPNWLAAYFCILIFIPLGHYLKSKNIWSFIQFAFFFFILLFTRSRSGLLAFGISSVVFWATPLLFPPKLGGNPKGVLKPLIFSLLTIFVSLLFIPNPIKDLFIKSTAVTQKPVAGTSLETGGTESGNIRKIVWTGAIRIWQSSAKTFWLGTGPETFAMSYYQFRPIEHNNTSEWELLYNKAHNEFLNYLATTGILGLGSYLVLLACMAIVLINNSPLRPPLSLRGGSEGALSVALLTGWITILVTNFWGFSVVIVQVFMFLLPAFAIILNSPPDQNQNITKKNSYSSLIIIILILFSCYGIIMVAKYWLADVYYATGDTAYQSYVLTSQPIYILSAYKQYSLAHEVSPKEPAITAQLAFTTAYVSLLTSEKDSTTAAQLAQYAKLLANQAVAENPHHPNLYKTASKSMIVLSVFDETNLLAADRYLASAQKISPTDPRIPYNRGIIYKQLKQDEQAKTFFRQSIYLKPDFPDPKLALEGLSNP